MTVAAVWAEYTADQQFTSKSASTQYTDRNRYNLHAADRIGSKFVDDLAVKPVEDFITAICSDKRVGRRGRKLGGDGAAKKVIRLLSTMTAWALKRGWVKVNPFVGHALRPDRARTEIVEGEEFKSIFSALEAMEADGRLPTVKARALRVLWATGARRSEITGLRWRHVRLDDERIVFGSDEHKGGRVSARRGREGVPRIIDLPPIAHQAIAAQLPLDGSMPIADALVFPPMLVGARQLELSRAWRDVRKAARSFSNYCDAFRPTQPWHRWRTCGHDGIAISRRPWTRADALPQNDIRTLREVERNDSDASRLRQQWGMSKSVSQAVTSFQLGSDELGRNRKSA